MATAKATTDHDEIRNWVEARGGHPARVKRTGSRKDPGVLRIDFPGFSGEDTLEEIPWEEFFEWFDRNDLAVLLSDEEGNRFNKLVSRETAAPTRSAAAARRRSSGGKKAASSKKASSTRKASSSTKKASGSTKKASSSTKKAASSKKAASTKKASSSTKKASTKKASTKKASTKKVSTSTKKARSSKKATTKKASTAKKSSSTRRVAAPSKKTTSKKTTSKKTSTKKASTKKAGGAGNVTTDHDEIRRWVEARGGFPAHVRQTGRKRGDLGVLRIDYPGFSGKDTLERVDWEEWFEAFDRNRLAFLHDNKRNSRFSKLVNR